MLRARRVLSLVQLAGPVRSELIRSGPNSEPISRSYLPSQNSIWPLPRGPRGSPSPNLKAVLLNQIARPSVGAECESLRCYCDIVCFLLSRVLLQSESPKKVAPIISWFSSTGSAMLVLLITLGSLKSRWPVTPNDRLPPLLA
jgi:hypothetical protein